MHLQYSTYRLLFRHPFGVSSNTRHETETIFVKLVLNGLAGYGEACLPQYLGGDVTQLCAFLDKAGKLLANHKFKSLADTLNELAALEEGNHAAKAALDIALHDLYSKQTGLPVHELLNAQPPPTTYTAHTIALDNIEKLEQKLIEASDFSILKIKAGTGDDKKLIRNIRKLTYKPLYVDVNQGWKDRHQVIDMIGWMREQNVVLVEQPMPVQMLDEMAWVKEKSALPIIADESARTIDDLRKIKGAFNGINLKLMKCGGLKAAKELITEARLQGMKIMLGCMAESSCGVAAMSKLLSCADFVDLDAPLLYRNDPFSGLNYSGGRIIPASGPGLGVSPAENLFS